MFKIGGVLLLMLSISAFVSAENLLEASESQAQKNNKNAQLSQKKVDGLYDSTRSDLAEYRTITNEIEQLKVYNRQMREIVRSQNEELTSLQQQIDQVEQTQQGIMPLMERMLMGLEQFVQLDLPFLLEERQDRISVLRALLVAGDTTVSEKFRRVLEAYQIELEYGRTIEAYRANLSENTMVDYLRIGRVALYHLSLDGQSASIWDKKSQQWVKLDDAYTRSLRKGLSIARQQAAPSLLELPLPTLETRS